MSTGLTPKFQNPLAEYAILSIWWPSDSIFPSQQPQSQPFTDSFEFNFFKDNDVHALSNKSISSANPFIPIISYTYIYIISHHCMESISNLPV